MRFRAVPITIKRIDRTEICHASKTIVMAGLDPAIHPASE
jgi:hypothetical protein